MSLQITVLIAGVIDPKWPLSALNLCQDAQRVATKESPSSARALVSRKLSPFDEAAIECALKLRDADASRAIRIVVACENPDDGLLRAVAAFCPNQLIGLDISRDVLWDAQATGSVLAKAVADAVEGADLVLLGREFGDFDDGSVAPCLAEILGWPFVGLAEGVRITGTDRVIDRARDDFDERIRYDQAVVVSVTNAKGNRLRHPLMKNVMAAKQAQLEIVAAELDEKPARRQPLSIVENMPKSRSAIPCRMIGGSPVEQAKELVNFLRSLELAQ